MPGYRAKKRLGQNFLKTKSVIDRAVALLDPQPDDTIIEIGPGRGALTLPLCESGARIIAVEFDRDLIGYLKSLLKKYDRVELIAQDFLGFDPAVVESPRFKLIGNLPYNITSPVIDYCVKHRDRIALAVLMVQKELGARLVATPGSRDWSPLSIFTQMSFEVELGFDVAPKHFHPPPQVISSVLRLTRRPDAVSSSPQLEAVVRAAFRQRRKQMVNNLTSDLVSDTEALREIFDEMQLDPRVRAEAVSIDQFLNLTERLTSRKLV